MNPPIENSWSTYPFERHDDDGRGPEPFSRKLAETLRARIEGRPDDDKALVRVDVLRHLLEIASPPPRHAHRGASIYDEVRHLKYDATLDPVTGELDYLRVTITDEDFIVENALRRVSVDRVRRALLAQLREDARARRDADDDEAFTLGLPGSLTPRSARSPAVKPPTEEVARLIERGYDRHRIAANYGATLRTADRWATQARVLLDQRKDKIRGKEAI